MNAVDQLVVQATTDLFQAYGVRVKQDAFARPRDAARDTSLVSAIVEESGRSNYGVRLLLVTTFDLVASCHPTRSPETFATRTAGDWLYVRDWTRELANQVLGRVLNRLGMVGVQVTMASPRALSGVALECELKRGRRPPHHFSSERGWLDVSFEARLTEEQVRALGDGEGPISRGGMLWFEDGQTDGEKKR